MRSNAYLSLISVLITNIGNGAHTLAVASLIYEITGSALTFGLILSSEFIIALIIQTISGSIIDRSRPKSIMVFADLSRGLIIISAGIAVLLGSGIWLVIISIVYLNLMKPFYRAASFSITPNITENEEELTRLNAYLGTAVQAGQILGVVLVGIVMTFFSPVGAFLINGISFVLAGLLTLLIRGEKVEILVEVSKGGTVFEKYIQDWREIGKILRKNATLVFHLILTSGDFISVALINLFIVPINQKIADTPIHLSLIDGSFAVGSLMTALVTVKIIRNLGSINSSIMGLGFQILAFTLLAFADGLKGLPVAMGAMLIMGSANTISLTMLRSKLQMRSKGPVKGRIGSLSHLMLAAIASVVLPAFGYFMQREGINFALVGSALFMSIYLLAIVILSSRRFFGEELFTRPIKYAK